MHVADGWLVQCSSSAERRLLFFVHFADPLAHRSASSQSHLTMAAQQPQPQPQPIAPSLRVLTACYDDEGIYCYQAYKPAIGEEAARRGRFDGIAGFSPTRMTWIKVRTEREQSE